MVPMPIDSLKNASPIAINATSAVILEKSGANRKASPCAAPGSIRLRTPSTSSRMNSTGINFLVTASMPLATPSSRMPPMNSSTPHCHSSDCSGSDTSAPNAAEVCAGSLLRMSPPMALNT